MKDYIHEANSRIDERFEDQLFNRVGDALGEEGAQIYIRKMNGRLVWIKGNVHGGGQEWQELTPNLAEDRISELRETSKEESLAMLREKLLQKKAEEYKVGWYQSAAGALYNYNGEIWTDGSGANVGMTLGKYNGLEYLG